MIPKSAAREEAILLAEYNHRLFNTLHVVAAEVANCSRVKDEREMRPMLYDLGERLQALAGLHRLLALSDGCGFLEDHCRALCLLLVKVFGRQDVTPQVRMEDVALDRTQSSKIALMVVELMTNCLKHSLKQGLGGTIWVDLRERRGEVELSVSDSLKAPVRSSAKPRILEALARSLAGEAFVVDREGYTAGVRIPLNPIDVTPNVSIYAGRSSPRGGPGPSVFGNAYEPACGA